MNFFDGTVLGKRDDFVFQETTRDGAAVSQPITVFLDNATAPALRRYLGKKVVFGIRPEHIKCRPPMPGTPPERGLAAVVEIVQPLGSETHLHLVGHAHSFVARVGVMDRFSVNQELSLAFDARHTHFFDPATGSAIE